MNLVLYFVLKQLFFLGFLFSLLFFLKSVITITFPSNSLPTWIVNINDSNLCASSFATELDKMEDNDDEEQQDEDDEMKAQGSSSRKRKAPSHSS